MKKIYQLTIALVLMALYAMDATATIKRVPLTADMMFEWNGWGADAQKASETPFANCAFNIGKPSGQPYGDSEVNAYADLSAYKTLEIYYTSGTPRPMLNRDVAGGQWSANEAESHLIEYPKGGGDTWSGKYFIKEEGLLKVDLAQLVADKGFAHLHAIKGADWKDVTVTKLALISDNGRVELEAGMFKCWTDAGPDAEEVLEDCDWASGEKFGCDVNFYRNVSGGDVAYGSTHVIYLWYADLTGTKKMYFTGEKGLTLRVLYNRQAPEEGDTDVHGHAVPETQVTIGDDGTAVLDVEALGLEYFHVNCIKVAWGASALKLVNIEIEGSVQGSGKINDPMDNVAAAFEGDVVAIKLGSNTNLKDLLGSQERLLFPNECGKLTIDGKETPLISVEGMMVGDDAYVFLFIDYDADPIEDNESVVLASFKNPDDAAQQLKFKSGLFEGTVVPDVVDLQGEYEMGIGSYYSNVAKLPTLKSADPELGSINLPVSQTEFKVEFTGKVNATELKATFDGVAMTVAPSEGFSTEFTLTRKGGDVTVGIHEIQLYDIMAEQDFFEEVGEETIKYSFGTIQSDEEVETLMTDGFAESGNGTVPASWIVDNDGEDRSGVTGLWGGCRVVEASGSFATHVLYLCSRGYNGNEKLNDGHAIYGSNEEHKLTLDAKTYHLTADVGGWDGTNRALKVQVVSEDTEDVIAETIEPVTVEYTKGKNHVDMEFTVEEPGNYLLKFFPCNTSGNPAGWADALAIGNIMVQYIPNVMGIEMMQKLKEALDAAEIVRDDNADEKYEGEAFTTLDNLIEKYRTEPVTAPSAFEKATEDLKAATAAMEKHHELCDSYYDLPLTAYEKLQQYSDTKFANDKYYAQLKAAFDKYATVTEDDVVIPNVISNDEQMQSAIDELNAAIAKTAMFTEGESSNGTVGYAALRERIRRGIENLKAMGVSEEDALLVEAEKALGDDEDVAQALKQRTAQEFYTQYNTMFAEGTTYDFSIFVKNPNIYVTKTSKQDVTAAPGWTVTNLGEGSLGDLWYINGGGTHPATDDVPADEAISSQGNVTLTQEITDLPAGVYQLTVYMGERRSDNDFKGFGQLPEDISEDATDEEKTELQLADARETIFPQEFFFVNTSVTAAGEYDNQTPVTTNGTSWGATDNNRLVTDEITIVDGKATIGVKSSGEHTWFALNDMQLTLVAAANFDYAKALSDLMQAIETLDNTTAKVRAIELFDLNGRRLQKAQKGLTIVKKVMSDGSIRTEKVVVR